MSKILTIDQWSELETGKFKVISRFKAGNIYDVVRVNDGTRFYSPNKVIFFTKGYKSHLNYLISEFHEDLIHVSLYYKNENLQDAFIDVDIDYIAKANYISKTI